MTLLRRSPQAVTLAAVTTVVLVVSSLIAEGGAVPAGIYGVGLVGGAVVALHAAGIVLVYRASRIVNFSQISMSALGASIFVGLVQQRLLLVGLRAICPPCLSDPSTVGEVRAGGAFGEGVLRAAGLADAAAATPLAGVTDPTGQPLDPRMLAAAAAPGWLVQVTYWLSLLIALAVAAVVVWALYQLVVKRFRDAPRLILTVLTLGAGHAATVVARVLLSPLLSSESGAAGDAKPPIGGTFEISPAVFGAIDVIIVVAAIGGAAALGMFLRRGRSGVAMRAAAENPERAETLGIGLDRITGSAWVIAGLLGAAAGILGAAQVGDVTADGFGTLVRVLAAAVVGRMAGLRMTVAGALAIGVMDQSVLWATGSGAYTSLLLLVLIVSLLTVQRARASRADAESSATWVAAREIRPVPRELSSVGVVRSTRRALAIGAGVLVAAYPWFMSPGQTSAAMASMVMAMLGLSLLVLTGWAGQISLAHMGFAAVGGWIAAATDLPFPVALAAGGLCGGLLAVAVGIPALRLRGLHLAVSSLALGAVVAAFLLDERSLGRFARGSVARPSLLGMDFEDDRAFYYVVALLLAATIAVVVGLRRSRVARVLIATRDNEGAAQAFGIDLVRARLAAFGISGAIAATAGVVLVSVQRGFESLTFAPEGNVTVFLMTVVGGLGSVAGPVIGAAYLAILDLLRGTAFGSVAELLLSPGVGVVALLLFLPGGLSAAVFGLRDAWLRRVASRLRIDVPSLTADRAAGDGRLPLAPKREPGGGSVLVPVRYRPEEQWMIHSRSGGTP